MASDPFVRRLTVAATRPKFLERFQIILNGEPKDRNGAALTGDYVSLKNVERAVLLFLVGDGTASNDLDFTIYEASDVSGTGAQALACMLTGDVYTQFGGDITAVEALTGWTQETVATAASNLAHATSGESVGVLAVEITPDELSDGFDCVRADIASPGAAKVIASCWILEMKRQTDPTLMDNPRVD